jgi:hypothetical protein
MSIIGTCDCCERRLVIISRCEAYGIETYACYLCRGDDSLDPYGEYDEMIAQYNEDNGQFGVGA